MHEGKVAVGGLGRTLTSERVSSKKEKIEKMDVEESMVRRSYQILHSF